MKRISITTRLILSFVAIIVLMVALYLIVANRVVHKRFSDFIIKSGSKFSGRVVPILEQYYLENGGWEGVENAFVGSAGNTDGHFGMNRMQHGNRGMPGLMIATQGERFLILDGDQIVFDSHPNGVRINNPENLAKYGVPLNVNGKRVGTFLSASVMGIMSDDQSLFITMVNRAFIWIGVISILLVFLVAIWQSKSIVEPLHEMAEAARRLSKGDYSQRVQVNQKDELGEVAIAFNQMAAELSKQSELRQGMMADVAHELRTPLSVLKIDLESMEDGLMEMTPENVRLLQEEVSHLNHLVEDLRMLSLADAGDLRFEKSRVEINSMVQEIVDRQQNIARERGIQLQVQVSKKKSFVLGDPQRLNQVLVNLIANAIQHTPNGMNIFITVEEINEQVQVSVTNDGSWIAHEDLEKIFDRFYRVEKSRNRDLGGSGLGLAIARSLIQTHGGIIWAESKEGVSTTFKFTLPLLGD